MKTTSFSTLYNIVRATLIIKSYFFQELIEIEKVFEKVTL